jgi:hypothetical protein
MRSAATRAGCSRRTRTTAGSRRRVLPTFRLGWGACRRGDCVRRPPNRASRAPAGVRVVRVGRQASVHASPILRSGVVQDPRGDGPPFPSRRDAARGVRTPTLVVVAGRVPSSRGSWRATSGPAPLAWRRSFVRIPSRKLSILGKFLGYRQMGSPSDGAIGAGTRLADTPNLGQTQGSVVVRMNGDEGKKITFGQKSCLRVIHFQKRVTLWFLR